ncbi:MAG: ABC transporter substrate-binding protein [Deferribacteres bacterium]|nr:ABC transporter substrate-binding protein [Deferribacteres bacterium]
MRYKGRIFTGFIAAAVILAGFIFAGCEKKAEVRETFKIGAVLPLTGNLGFIGEGFKNAMLLAREQLGDTKYNYEILFEDDQHDTKLTASAANKFISIDKVDAIVTLGDSTAPVVSPLATQHNIIHFGLAVQAYVAKGDNNFIHWTPAVEEARVLVKELKRRGIRTVGLLGSNYEGFVELMNALREKLKGTDIRILSDQTFKNDEKDFRTFIARAKQTEPDIYVVLAMTPSLEILAKQMKEAGINTPLTSMESFDVTQEPALFEGYWYVSAAVPTGSFSSAYEAKYNTTPPVTAANGYDIFNLIVTAVEKAGDSPSQKPPTEKISRELRNIKNYPGALGTLSIREDGVVLSRASVKMIKNGKPVALEL